MLRHVAEELVSHVEGEGHRLLRQGAHPVRQTNAIKTRGGGKEGKRAGLLTLHRVVNLILGAVNLQREE